MTHIPQFDDLAREQALQRSTALGWRVLEGGGSIALRRDGSPTLIAIPGDVLRPTNHACRIVLDASIPQHFAAVRNFEALEPIVLDLARRQKLYFGQLVGLSRSEMFQGTSCGRKRSRFERELASLGLEFRAA